MKASRKRALRAPKSSYRIRALDPYGRAIIADAETRLGAMIALNRAVRNTGNTIDWDTISVK